MPADKSVVSFWAYVRNREVSCLSNCGIITKVYEDGLGFELGLEVGDKILEINGQALNDIIDYRFALADEEIELLIEKADGEQEIIEFDKDYDEELGVEFESAVFDGIKKCANKCIFCFVDQMAPKMRKTLYVKDDDYRMSFLYGNFITLTNLSTAQLERIKRLHLSPLFVSVHTTDGELRAKMLNNKNAANIMNNINALIKADIELHTQVVLCPGVNDADYLEKTISDLVALQPQVLSLAIVPVGLTKYREKCYKLEKFTKEQAQDIVKVVSTYQEKNRKKHGHSFVYLGDEFYLLAQMPIPETELYDGFPQLENGIGLVRNFIDEWDSVDNSDCNDYQEPIYLDIVCGKSAQQILENLVSELKVNNLNLRVVSIENNFFGKNINVSGLLTGNDISQQLKSVDGNRTGVIIPRIALRNDEDVFLDDYSLQDLQTDLKTKVKVASSGAELKDILLNWK